MTIYHPPLPVIGAFKEVKRQVPQLVRDSRDSAESSDAPLSVGFADELSRTVEAKKSARRPGKSAEDYLSKIEQQLGAADEESDEDADVRAVGGGSTDRDTVCPITSKVFVDPVWCPKICKHVFERKGLWTRRYWEGGRSMERGQFQSSSSAGHAGVPTATGLEDWIKTKAQKGPVKCAKLGCPGVGFTKQAIESCPDMLRQVKKRKRQESQEK